MQALEVLPLSHETVEWSRPALGQHLDPLHVHLKAEQGQLYICLRDVLNVVFKQ